MASDASGSEELPPAGAVTVIVDVDATLPVKPAIDAVIVAVPADTPVTRPVALTVAILFELEVHVAESVTSVVVEG
jgi:hypothetical protein